MTTFCIFRDPHSMTDADLRQQASRLHNPPDNPVTLRKPSHYNETDEYPAWRRAVLQEYDRRFPA